MNNTHQQPSRSWEEEFGLKFGKIEDVTGFYDEHTKEIVKLSKRDKQIIDFIQSLLTSHSQAIRERVKKLGKPLPDFNKSSVSYKPCDYASAKSYNEALNDILALLNDSDVDEVESRELHELELLGKGFTID